MDSKFFDLVSESQRPHTRIHRPRMARFGRIQVEAGFDCKHCNKPVSSASFLSGVRNRNHCPYCLWSRHLDLYTAGDRLSACKSLMQPIGLTLKATRKRYGPERGELMLIHECMECQIISINRIAADDDPQTLFEIYKDSFLVDASTRVRLVADNIRILGSVDKDTVCLNLFGQKAEQVEMLFPIGLAKSD